MQYTCAYLFCLVERTVAFMVSVKTLCGTQLYLNILSLVLNLLESADFEISLTALWVVTRMVFSACFREIFHLEARCSGLRPVLCGGRHDSSVCLDQFKEGVISQGGINTIQYCIRVVTLMGTLLKGN